MRVAGWVLAGLGAMAVGPLAAAEFTLTILHTNDLHARIDEVTAQASTCLPADRSGPGCYGGMPRLHALIQRLRAADPNPLVVDAGDRFQGSLFYGYYKAPVIRAFTNLIGYQALALGNHEFDDGPAELARFLDGLVPPVLAANMDAAAEPLLAGCCRASTVLDVGGERVGVIGLITPQTAVNSKAGANVRFNDPAPALRQAVAELKAQGVNKIIALSHVGFAIDQQLAAAVDDVDVYVGGHSHTLLHNSDPDAAGPSPTVVRQPSGRPSLLVQTGYGGRYLGRLQVTFDEQGVPVRWQGDPIKLDGKIAKDATAQAFVEALNVPLEPLRNQRVGTVTADLTGDRGVCRVAECTMGSMITDALRWQTRDEGTQVAFINGGSIRASIPAGTVSVGQVLEVLPFSNTIATLELSGADLREALEYGVSRAENPGNDGTGRFPQVSGLRFVWDAAAAVGQRITTVTVQAADGSWQPLDPAQRYHVATNDYLRKGGDGYALFRDRALNPYDGGMNLEEAVMAYLRQHDPLTVAADGRIARR